MHEHTHGQPGYRKPANHQPMHRKIQSTKRTRKWTTRSAASTARKLNIWVCWARSAASTARELNIWVCLWLGATAVYIQLRTVRELIIFLTIITAHCSALVYWTLHRSEAITRNLYPGVFSCAFPFPSLPSFSPLSLPWSGPSNPA